MTIDRLSILSEYCTHNGEQITKILETLLQIVEANERLEKRVRELEINDARSIHYDLSNMSDYQFNEFMEFERNKFKNFIKNQDEKNKELKK